MSPTRVLSPTALGELLRGNHQNYITVKVGEDKVNRVHRPVAMRFSRVWRKALQNPACRELTVTFPPDPPAALTPPLLSPYEAHKFALRFIIQWMEEGGADSEQQTAIPFPRTRPGLHRLLALAQILKVPELITRASSDLAESPARARKCNICKRFEHPGEACLRCWHCEELGHGKKNCAKFQAESLERERRRREWEERQKARDERQKAKEARDAIRKQKAEAQERKEEARMVRSGEMAVGDGGKTIRVWK